MNIAIVLMNDRVLCLILFDTFRHFLFLGFLIGYGTLDFIGLLVQQDTLRDIGFLIHVDTLIFAGFLPDHDTLLEPG